MMAVNVNMFFPPAGQEWQVVDGGGSGCSVGAGGVRFDKVDLSDGALPFKGGLIERLKK